MPNLNYTDYVERFGTHNLEVITTESEYTAAITELKRLKKNHCHFKFTVKGPCCGVEFQTTWGGFDNKEVKKCSACNYKALGEGLRDSYADVKKKFEDLGVTLVTTEDEYNADTSGLSRFEFKIIAKCGHERETKFFNFEREALNHGICMPCCAKMKYTKVNLSSEYVTELFTKAGCEILSSYENNIFKNITFKAACSHTSTEIMNDIPFKDKKKINCKTCRDEEALIIRNNLVNEDGTLKAFDVESEAMDWIIELLSDKFDIMITEEGCRADIIIKPIEVKEDKWVQIQLKSAEASKDNQLTAFGFGLNNDYTGMIMLFTAKIIDCMWIIDYDVINTYNTLTISLYEDTKYFKYKVPPCYLYQKMYEFYNSDKFTKVTIEEVMKRDFQSVQNEDKYKNMRKKKISFLPYEEVQNYSVVDFKINNYNIQEKIAVKSCNLYTLKLHKSYGKNNKIAYNSGDNDFYWIHLDNWKHFFVIPEAILIENGFITHNDQIGTKYIGISLTGKKNAWILDYKYDYDNLDEEKLKTLFKNDDYKKTDIIINKYIHGIETYHTILEDLTKLEYTIKTTEEEFNNLLQKYKYPNEVPITVVGLCGHEITASLFNLKGKIKSMCINCERKDFDEIYDIVQKRFAEFPGVILKTTKKEVMFNNLTMDSSYMLEVTNCAHLNAGPHTRNSKYLDMVDLLGKTVYCASCAKKLKNNGNLTYENLVERFTKVGCMLLTSKENYENNYMSAKDTHKFIASCNHETSGIPEKLELTRRKSPLKCALCK